MIIHIIPRYQNVVSFNVNKNEFRQSNILTLLPTCCYMYILAGQDENFTGNFWLARHSAE